MRPVNISTKEVLGFLRHYTYTHNEVNANYIDNDQKEKKRSFSGEIKFKSEK